MIKAWEVRNIKRSKKIHKIMEHIEQKILLASFYKQTYVTFNTGLLDEYDLMVLSSEFCNLGYTVYKSSVFNKLDQITIGW